MNRSCLTLLLVTALTSLGGGCSEEAEVSRPKGLQPEQGTLTIRPDSTVILAASRSTLMAINDAQTVSWTKRFADDDQIVGSPTSAANSTVYLLTMKRVYAVDTGGSTIFRVPHPFGKEARQPPERFTMAPLPDSTLVMSDGARRIVNLDLAGKIKWRFNLPGSAGQVGPPVAGPNGSVYLRSKTWLYVIGSSGKPRWRIPVRQLLRHQ